MFQHTGRHPERVVGVARDNYLKGKIKPFFRWYMDRTGEGRRQLVCLCYNQGGRSEAESCRLLVHGAWEYLGGR
eukprot:4416874-Karenia_brevis.AAC.1